MAELKEQIPFSLYYPHPDKIPTSEEIRGLSINETVEHFGDAGMLRYCDVVLQELDLVTPAVIDASHKSFRAHAGDWRTYSHQFEHIAYVTTFNAKVLGLRQEHDVITDLMHDTVEDHADIMLAIMRGSRSAAVDSLSTREECFRMIGEQFGELPAAYNRGLTNPILEPGDDKNLTYHNKMVDIGNHELPGVPAHKTGDIGHNAGENHLTLNLPGKPPKRRLNDVRYYGCYGTIQRWLLRDDSLIDGPTSEMVSQFFERAYERTAFRLTTPDDKQPNFSKLYYYGFQAIDDEINELQLEEVCGH